ncbi:MAG TPA: SGNH/GDSL hydrolase family protein [Candidatus Xenobia bacterium]|jgi:lysophospholipase L1-like esterase
MSEAREVRRFLGKLGLFLLPLMLALGDFHTTPLPSDERSQTCQYDRELGWAPRPGLKTWYPGTAPFYVEQNSLGFRDTEHGPKTRPRVLFLGDSFVWGYDASQTERFTERLGEKMPGWEILNEGVSGYGTDQEYLMLRRTIDAIQPDVVMLIFTTENDRDDNSTNMRYGYYKPYFTAEDGELRLHGVPVQQSINFWYSWLRPVCKYNKVKGLVDKLYASVKPPIVTVSDPTFAILDATRRLVEGHRARFFVGLNDDAPAVQCWLDAHGVASVQLKTDLRFTSNGEHWTPAGHRFIADTIYRFLGNRLASNR